MPQSITDALFAQLPPDLVACPDEKTFFLIGWWSRMHKHPYSLRMHALKFIEWSTTGTSQQRFVWEVCKWPQGRGASWTFICWMLDGQAMWTKEFPSKSAAMAFFEQSPDEVMRSRDVVVDDVAEGARHRRAS